MAAVAQFHAEKCCYLVNAHTAEVWCLCSSPRQFLIYSTFVFVGCECGSSLWCVSGGQSNTNTHHLFSVFDSSKLSLRNISVRQESGHSERHGIFLSSGVYLLHLHWCCTCNDGLVLSFHWLFFIIFLTVQCYAEHGYATIRHPCVHPWRSGVVFT